jgi:4-diphosphocytidyl-2-C-methyl-D-erythritol kinase
MLEKTSGCKVNLLLNILGKRADGFHALETVMHPVGVYDHLTFAPAARDITLTCSDPSLPVNPKNLVHRAAAAFLQKARRTDGVRIHLEKRIPIAAGLGGGSGNAATTLLALNELFGQPLSETDLVEVAARLGSDIPFFLQDRPALATGRGELIQPLEFFPALRHAGLVMIHPGFGISTAWAYQQLSRHPAVQNGRPGRAQILIDHLRKNDASAAGREFYNSLEAPALPKYPLLQLFQDFLREHGAWVALMSGSGSTTFGLTENRSAAETLVEQFKSHFGDKGWTAALDLVPPGPGVGS